MASLLHRLEVGLQRAAGASERLRSQVDRIDGYMRTSRLLNISAIPPLSAAPNGPSGPGGPLEVKQEPAIPQVAYIHSAPAPATAPPVGPGGPVGNQMMQFQLPPELLADWPWPLDSSAHSEGFLPLAFE